MQPTKTRLTASCCESYTPAQPLPKPCAHTFQHLMPYQVLCSPPSRDMSSCTSQPETLSSQADQAVSATAHAILLDLLGGVLSTCQRVTGLLPIVTSNPKGTNLVGLDPLVDVLPLGLRQEARLKRRRRQRGPHPHTKKHCRDALQQEEPLPAPEPQETVCGA